MKTIYNGKAPESEERRKQLAAYAISREISRTLEYAGQLAISIVGSIREEDEYEKAYSEVQSAASHLAEALGALD